MSDNAENFLILSQKTIVTSEKQKYVQEWINGIFTQKQGLIFKKQLHKSICYLHTIMSSDIH